MAIEKMRLLSLIGEEQKIDYIIANYLIKSGIQLENAVKVLEKGWKLTYFNYNSDIKELLKRTENILNKLNINYTNRQVKLENTYEEIKEKIEEINNKFEQKDLEIQDKNKEIEKLLGEVIPLRHLRNIDINLKDIYNMEYIKFRYGKMPFENLEEIKNEIKDLDVVMVEAQRDEEEIWIMYFTSPGQSSKVDSLFNVMKFERIWLPEEVDCTVLEFINKVDIYIEDTKKQIKIIEKQIEDLKIYYERELQNYYNQLILLEKVNNIKKYVAHDDKGSFYMVGWIPYKNLQDILPKLEAEDIECVVKTNDEVRSDAPTKLKNNRLVRPFETIVKMYGVPNYAEMDPTTFVAITAFLMFGFMFGDVGQGAVIFLIGIILAQKKVSLGPVLTAGGISAIIFGFLYGSIFGKEGIIKPIITSPMENIATMLIAGITSGAILIIIAMILNIRNGIRNKDKSKILFDKNGLAGLIFYVSILILVVGFLVKGKLLLSGGVLVLVIVVPLILILFKENIMRKINKTKDKGIRSSFIEKIFEIIEMLLSFASNTISFVRLAAFAINHVGLCMAVYILSQMASGAGTIAIAIIGNIIVIVLEGLIVAIQVLRLEYYELFSRFYSGDGKEYKPIDELI